MRISSLRSFSAVKGFTVLDRDGDAGRIEDAYFDRVRWVFRYLLLRHRTISRDILISPLIIEEIRWAERRLLLRLYDEEFEEGPAIDTETPITRGEEESYNEYFFIPDYWEGDDLWGEERTPDALGSLLRVEQQRARSNGGGDSFLLSASHVQQYALECSDGEVGVVGDFLWNPQSFAIRYLVIDIGRLLSGKSILLSPLWITELDREAEKISVELPKNAMQEAPAYERGEPITPAYEKNLMSHYNALEYKT
jgi:hypothetical protein